MPSVPRFGLGQTDVGITPQVRVSPDLPKEAFGLGSADVSEGFSKLGQAASKVAIQEQLFADQLKNKMADLELNKVIENQYKDGGALSLKGVDAIERSETTFSDSFDKAKEDLLSKASTDGQRQYLESRYAELKSNMGRVIYQHTASERYKVDTSTTQATNEMLQRNFERFALDPAAPKMFEKWKQEMYENVSSYGLRNGLDQRTIENQFQESLGRAHFNAVKRMVDNDRMGQAREYYAKNGGQFYGMENETDNLLKQGSTKETAIKFAYEALDKNNTEWGAIQYIRENVKDPEAQQAAIQVMKPLMADKNAAPAQVFEAKFNESVAYMQNNNVGFESLPSSMVVGLLPEHRKILQTRSNQMRGLEKRESDPKTVEFLSKLDAQSLGSMSRIEFEGYMNKVGIEDEKYIRNRRALSMDGINGESQKLYQFNETDEDRNRLFLTLRSADLLKSKTLGKVDDNEDDLSLYQDAMRKYQAKYELEAKRTGGKVGDDFKIKAMNDIAKQTIETDRIFGLGTKKVPALKVKDPQDISIKNVNVSSIKAIAAKRNPDVIKLSDEQFKKMYSKQIKNITFKAANGLYVGQAEIADDLEGL